MFLNRLHRLIKQNLARSVCLALIGLFFNGGDAIAQYGFTPFNASSNGYSNEWGGYYLGAAAQSPNWNRSPGYYQAPTGYQPPRQLGVYTQNTANGVIVGQVVSGSVAEKAGLKTGDLIISVAGNQVGIVNGRIIDLMDVITANLDYFGRVSSVVLDGNARVVKNLVFDFSSSTTAIASVNGQVFLDSNFPVYRSGTIKIDLINTTRPNLTASGGNTYVQMNGTGPFAFSIAYDIRMNSPTDQFRLVATYFDSNRQAVSSSYVDIGGLNPSVSSTYNLRLLASQAVAPYGAAYGAYVSGPNMINDIFRQYLNRAPSISEAQAWAQQISTMNLNEKDVKADILATPAFYDRAGNDPTLFIKQMIEANTRLPASFEQIQFWSARLGFYGGNRLQLAREYIYSF